MDHVLSHTNRLDSCEENGCTVVGAVVCRTFSGLT